MAITHYIDTSVPEIARARMKSQTQRVPEAFPVLVYGDTRDHNFIFMNQGTIESFSGNASYSLRVTLGEVQAGPTSGQYVLTCGTSGTVDALSDASTIQAALNSLTTIISDGGVVVTGTFPNFLVTWNTVGVKTAFTADATLLVPTSSISLVTTATGSATVRNQVMIVLRQSAIVSQSTWSTITNPANGWTGTISTNTAGALTLLSSLGVSVGEFIEAATVLTAEVLNNAGTPISYYQTPITLRAKNLDPSASVSPPITTYALGDILYGKADGTLGRLPGNTTTGIQFLSQTGTGSASAAPAWQTLTSGSFLLTGSGTGLFSNTDLTYSTPTLSVPDGYTISSAGSIGLTAGGSNKAITFTPSDSGAQGAVSGAMVPSGSTIIGTGGFQVYKQATSGGVFPSIELQSFRNGNSAQSFFVAASANGTQASPTTNPVSTTIGGFRFYGRANGAWRNLANVSAETSSSFSDSDFTSVLRLGPSTNSAQANLISMFGGNTTNSNSVVVGGASSISTRNVLTIDPGSNVSFQAWGSTGILTATGARTFTDSTSSGTVATAVANSFAVPAFAASSATTFTDFANGYWAGAPSRGANVTGGNPWCGWFASGGGGGNVRIDGSLYFGGITGTVIAGSTTTTGITGGAGNMTITAGTGNSRTLTLQTTTSGGVATNALVLSAAQQASFASQVAVNGATVSTTTGLITLASATGASSLRIPHGTAPTSPVDGDIWTTTSGLFVRINGVTVGPLT